MITIKIKMNWFRRLGFFIVGAALFYVGEIFTDFAREANKLFFDVVTRVDLVLTTLMFVIMNILIVFSYAGCMYCFLCALFDGDYLLSLKKYINIEIED